MFKVACRAMSDWQQRRLCAYIQVLSKQDNKSEAQAIHLIQQVSILEGRDTLHKQFLLSHYSTTCENLMNSAFTQKILWLCTPVIF